MAEDPYKVLGVARDATPEAIKKAYRKLARQNHPDLNPGKPEAEARFKAASAAHDLLSDPERRARFDRGEIDAEGQERPPPRPAGGWRRHAEAPEGGRYDPFAESGFEAGDFGDLFADILARQRAAETAPRPGRDVAYRLSVPFLSAVLGATEQLVLPDGRQLSVKIPPGVVSGQSLRLRGQGAPGRNGGPAGNAVIELEVEDHPLFRRDGFDLHLDLPVTLKEAVLGGPVTVPAPAGPLRVTLPAGSDTGRQVRLRGKGVAAEGSRPAGDLLLTLRVVLGPPDPALEAFVRDWTPQKPFDPREAMDDTP
ncbi:DnaJ C-terminal domain-containing protein [Falsiroseomonas tokyonensis]|uniref:DnaJ C-terminal domain-containing protein n=1 Tax=Falsiroseomonas tokyonensis TaxID=430521 RepID=A0ABV7BRV1_9PROT|nr:J domain-containing protein [Falsiroseomonas tokyonensis]MBU8537377.1 J domain-containing protein [Falsiroseomonas tokyonensis]